MFNTVFLFISGIQQCALYTSSVNRGKTIIFHELINFMICMQERGRLSDKRHSKVSDELVTPFLYGTMRIILERQNKIDFIQSVLFCLSQSHILDNTIIKNLIPVFVNVKFCYKCPMDHTVW